MELFVSYNIIISHHHFKVQPKLSSHLYDLPSFSLKLNAEILCALRTWISYTPTSLPLTTVTGCNDLAFLGCMLTLPLSLQDTRLVAPNVLGGLNTHVGRKNFLFLSFSTMLMTAGHAPCKHCILQHVIMAGDVLGFSIIVGVLRTAAFRTRHGRII